MLPLLRKPFDPLDDPDAITGRLVIKLLAMPRPPGEDTTGAVMRAVTAWREVMAEIAEEKTRRRREEGWYAWGDTVAVVAGYDAFSLNGTKGWIPVNEVEVTRDGRRISAAVARKVGGEDYWLWGDPPLKPRGAGAARSEAHLPGKAPTTRPHSANAAE